ncbi:MAG: hypothetical protein NW703_13965 [Nitrospiraceae bacterium]
MVILRESIARILRISRAPWKPVTGWQISTGSIVLAWFFFLLRTDEDGFIFLDHVNLVFHEAGHVIFGLLGSTLGLYGGTVGQLAMPAIVWAAFWRQRDMVACAMAGIWFFENFLNIAWYMADARLQALPLVGGGEHDWAEILARWDVLMSDQLMAQRLALLGWIGMAASWGWLGWRWWSRSRTDNSFLS